MVVQHNLTAINANRMLGITQGTLSSSTEKLSSGYKINRAADDAAGLSISEKMRKQIRGLDQASSNAEDGISAVQTAEGALQEVTDMLQRMNELAVQSANETNSEADRSYIQDEVDQLVTEIDRVSETTKFNEIYLLKGDSSAVKGYSYSYGKFADDVKATVTMGKDSATNLTATIEFTDDGTTSEQNTIAKSLKSQGLTMSTTVNSAGDQVWSVSLNGDAKNQFNVVTTAENTFVIQNADGTKIATITAQGGDKDAGDTATITATAATAANRSNEIAAYYDKDGNKISANALENYVSYDTENKKVRVNADAKTVYDALGNVTSINVDDGEVTANQDKTAALNISFQVGADTSSANKISVKIDAMSAKSLGINGLKVDGTDSTKSDGAVDTIAEAIQKVSTQRSALGAVQNRLEHTIKNLDNIVENTTAAESQIRDTDMATEMVKYSNANILSQAGQSMLAQSNQSNQGVLSLLG